MRYIHFAILQFAILLALPLLGANKKPSAEQQIPLDQYVQQANQRAHQLSTASPGSLYTSSGRLADSFRDVRASQIYDLVTVVVNETTSAVSTGTTKTSRASSVAASVASGLLPKGAVNALSNLATTSNNQALQGQGTTSRGTTITTTVTAEVTAVLPNGNLVVQGQKAILVNSEKQIITLRGIVRPDDLSPINEVSADRVARIEILINGKGVVNDAVKRPFFLYRLLLGLLPF
jgi:flagellar L-ring protein precursor FlgH